MEEKLTIRLSNDYSLVAYLNPSVPNCSNTEIIIGIENLMGEYVQDLVCVRESMVDKSVFETLVYADENDEDYTNKFNIPLTPDED